MRPFRRYDGAGVEVLTGELLLLRSRVAIMLLLLLLLMLLLLLLEIGELIDVEVGVVEDGLRIHVCAGALEHVRLSAGPSLVHCRIRWLLLLAVA